MLWVELGRVLESIKFCEIFVENFPSVGASAVGLRTGTSGPGTGTMAAGVIVTARGSVAEAGPGIAGTTGHATGAGVRALGTARVARQAPAGSARRSPPTFRPRPPREGPQLSRAIPR